VEEGVVSAEQGIPSKSSEIAKTSSPIPEPQTAQVTADAQTAKATAGTETGIMSGAPSMPSLQAPSTLEPTPQKESITTAKETPTPEPMEEEGIEEIVVGDIDDESKVETIKIESEKEIAAEADIETAISEASKPEDEAIQEEPEEIIVGDIDSDSEFSPEATSDVEPEEPEEIIQVGSMDEPEEDIIVGGTDQDEEEEIDIESAVEQEMMAANAENEPEIISESDSDEIEVVSEEPSVEQETPTEESVPSSQEAPTPGTTQEAVPETTQEEEPETTQEEEPETTQEAPAISPPEKRTKEEIIDEFTSIPGIGRAKAEILLESGYNSVQELLNEEIERLSSVKGIGKKLGKKIQKSIVDNGLVAIEPELVETPISPQEESGAASQSTQAFSCPLCGAIIPPGISICQRCGTPLVTKGGSSDQTQEQEKSEDDDAPGKVLEFGYTYMIDSKSKDKLYNLFNKQLKGEDMGLCITREYPEKVRGMVNIQKILWLTDIGDESSLRPRDLEKLTLAIEKHFKSSESPVVLLDGIEYLITNNNFISIIKLLQTLRDLVSINKAVLLLPVQPLILDPHQYNMLRREVDSLITLA